MCVGAGVHILGKGARGIIFGMWFVTCTGLEICVGAEVEQGTRGIINGFLQVTLRGGAGGDTTLGDGLAGSFCIGFCFMLKV